MTSPPAKHDPPDDRPSREDADAHPPLRGVEAGPQRHSDDPFAAKAQWISQLYGDCTRTQVRVIRDALAAVDRAAREECARIAEGSVGPLRKGERIRADGTETNEMARAMQFGLGGGRDAIAAAIRQTIES